MLSLDVVQLISGIILLTLGRRLYWFFVGAVGFIIGLSLATSIFQGERNLTVWIIALAAGVTGALLALFMQRVAAAVAGFLAAGYATSYLLQVADITITRANWLPFLVGGVIGALLAAFLFDWALILLSAWTGASQVVQAINMEGTAAIGVLVVLLVVGIGIQGLHMEFSKRD